MSDKMHENPLVSVCVITYNSAETVIETLDSIKMQTYSPIELVVSDDDSQDKTLELIGNWINENKDRFENVEMISSNINTGVTKNVNRACRKAKGVYIKDFAGDDILLPKYLENCVHYFEQHKEVDVLFTKSESFADWDQEKKIDRHENLEYFELTAEEQFNWVKCKGLPILSTPSCIYTKRILEKLDYFDERIPMWEDGPMYFKLAENNVKLYLLDYIGVHYRIRKESISHSFSSAHIKSVGLFYKYYWHKYDLKNNRLKAIYHFFKYFAAIHFDNHFWAFIYKMTQIHVNNSVAILESDGEKV